MGFLAHPKLCVYVYVCTCSCCMPTSDAYWSVVGGKLSLKGGVEKKKKKRKPSDTAEQAAAAATAAAASSAVQQASASSTSAISKVGSSAGHTAAELRHMEKLSQRQIEKLEKGELKSHRERVKDFNDYLGNLTEHYDLPKVSKGN